MPPQIHRNQYFMHVPALRSRIECRTVVRGHSIAFPHLIAIIFLPSFPFFLPLGVLRSSVARSSEPRETQHRHSTPAQQLGSRSSGPISLRDHRSPYQQEMRERWSSDQSSSPAVNLATECRTTKLLS